MSTTTEKEITVANGLGNADPSQVLVGATFTSEEGFNQEGKFDPSASNIKYKDTNVESAIDEVRRTLGYTKSYNELENKATTTTINELTFTVNNDKSVTVNGTATADTFLNLNYDGTNVFDDGNYIASGGHNDVWLEVITNNNVFVRDKGENVEFTIENTSNNWARLFVDGGTVVNNVTVYPMVKPSHIKNDTYMPFVPSVDGIVHKWIPKGNNTQPHRCYYIKYKNSITIFFVVPIEGLTTTDVDRVICEDVCGTFGISNFRESFTVGFGLGPVGVNNGTNVHVGISAKGNKINIERMGSDVVDGMPVYGQITLVTV